MVKAEQQRITIVFLLKESEYLNYRDYLTCESDAQANENKEKFALSHL